MGRVLTLAISGVLSFAQPALASGEVVAYIVAIDGAVFIATFLVIVFVLKCPVWLRVVLIALYAVTEWILYLLPVDLLRPAELNGPFHFALPAILCAIVYLVYMKFGVHRQHEAL